MTSDFSFSPVILVHVVAAVIALGLGALVFLRRKGTATHGWMGRTWAVLMLVVAISSFWITGSDGLYSWIHGLSVFVTIAIPLAVYWAMRGNITRHRRLMTGLYVGALIVAGGFSFTPDRLLGQRLWSNAVAQSALTPESAFIEAAQLAQRASAGDAKSIDGAVAAFESLSRSDPSQPLYAAYFGMATGLKAREAWMPWSKIKYAEQGLDQVDRALQALKPEHDRQLLRGAPVGIETRIVAARMFLKVPDEFFHRRAAGKKLIAEVLAHPQFAAAPAPLRAVGHLGAAEAARNERPDEELAQLKQVVALAPGSSAAEQARARLKELGQ